MAAWVRAEAFDKLQQWWDTSNWPRVYLQPGRDIPRQTDSHSCGLYAAVLADCLGAGVPLEHCTMAATDVVAARARLLENICTGLYAHSEPAGVLCAPWRSRLSMLCCRCHLLQQLIEGGAMSPTCASAIAQVGD